MAPILGQSQPEQPKFQRQTLEQAKWYVNQLTNDVCEWNDNHFCVRFLTTSISSHSPTSCQNTNYSQQKKQHKCWRKNKVRHSDIDTAFSIICHRCFVLELDLSLSTAESSWVMLKLTRTSTSTSTSTSKAETNDTSTSIIPIGFTNEVACS